MHCVSLYSVSVFSACLWFYLNFSELFPSFGFLVKQLIGSAGRRQKKFPFLLWLSNILVFAISKALEPNTDADMNFYGKFDLPKTFGIACIASNLFEKDTFI